MTTPSMIKIENPWDVQSLYEFQYFNCPTCSYKNPSKYDFVYHTFNTHPESVDYLRKISDGSFNDIMPLPLEDDSEFYDEKFVSNSLNIEENCQTFQNSSWNSIDTKEELITEELVKENEENVLNCHNCESCGISFSVEQHRKNPYKFIKNCKCEISRAGSGDLKKRIHKKKQSHKNYKCDSCDKSFSSEGHLKRHVNTNHEQKKDLIQLHTTNESQKEDYNCESCSKSFKNKYRLKNHIHTVHEGHKDFKCESCSKLFSHAHRLKGHIKKIHEGNEDHN